MEARVRIVAVELLSILNPFRLMDHNFALTAARERGRERRGAYQRRVSTSRANSKATRQTHFILILTPKCLACSIIPHSSGLSPKKEGSTSTSPTPRSSSFFSELNHFESKGIGWWGS